MRSSPGIGVLRDLFGRTWSLATHIEDLSPEDLQKRAAAHRAGRHEAADLSELGGALVLSPGSDPNACHFDCASLSRRFGKFLDVFGTETTSVLDQEHQT